MKIWLPGVKAGSGADVFTLRLSAALQRLGVDTEITWFPRRFEILPWPDPVSPPQGTSLIHANSWNAYVFGGFDQPLVTTVHHCVHDPEFLRYKSFPQAIYHSLLVRGREAKSFHLASANVTSSQFTSKTVAKLFQVAPPEVIPYWVDTTVFQPQSTKPREPHKPFRLLFVGNRSARKGWDILPTLMSQLGGEFELKFTCGLRGSGVTQGLPGNMIPTGELPSEADMVKEYQACDAVLCPSRLEGFGYAALEGMACGKPVIGFNSSSIPEVVGERCGILTPVDDVGELAEACRRMALDTEHYQEMAGECRERAVGFFNSQLLATKYVKLYERVLQA